MEYEGPDPGEDWGLHYPFEYVDEMTRLVRLSGFVAWPRPGGLNDQCRFFLRDMATYLERERIIKEDGVAPESVAFDLEDL